MRRPRVKTTFAVRLFFALCVLPMFLVFPYWAQMNNPNENVRTFMTMSLVEHKTFCVDKIVERFGWTNDMARVPGPVGAAVPPEKAAALGIVEAHYYSVKAPATSYAGVPVYWVFSKVVAPLLGHRFPDATTKFEDVVWWLRSATWALRLGAIQLPCFLFLIFFERYLRGITPDVTLRLSAVAAAGLGTNYLAYVNMFASHATFAVAAFTSFAITEREWRTRRLSEHRRPGKAFLAGFFAAWATHLEYHALPVSLILALFAAFVFWRPKNLLPLTIGGLLHAGGMMYFQWKAYGNPLTPGHKMVENAQFAAEHHEGLFGIKLPTLDAFGSLSVSPAFGFFGMSPFMWLGLLVIPFGLIAARGLPHERKVRRVSTVVWLLAMLGLWTIMSGAIEWRAGWTIGPRYLGAAPPFFAFGAVCALEHLSRAGLRNAWRGLAAGLALAGVLSVGYVSLVINTLPPQQITRPLVQFAWPLTRAGFVPHHVGEWFGWTSPMLWYLAAGAMVATTIVAALAAQDRPLGMLGRVAFFAIGLRLGMIPALTDARPEEGIAGPIDLSAWMSGWEPPGRDYIASARVDAERQGPRGPCAWHRLAALERVVNLEAAARADEARATGPASACPRRPPPF